MREFSKWRPGHKQHQLQQQQRAAAAKLVDVDAVFVLLLPLLLLLFVHCLYFCFSSQLLSSGASLLLVNFLIESKSEQKEMGIQNSTENTLNSSGNSGWGEETTLLTKKTSVCFCLLLISGALFIPFECGQYRVY